MDLNGSRPNITKITSQGAMAAKHLNGTVIAITYFYSENYPSSNTSASWLCHCFHASVIHLCRERHDLCIY